MDAPLVIAPPPVHVAPPAVVASDPRRVLGRALVVTFLLLLGIGNLDLMLHLDPNPSPLREVVPFPRPHLNRSLVHWPGDLRWYAKSSMGFRPALVRARGLLAWNWLHGSPAPTSVVRADPWLFMRNERVLDDFRRIDPFTDAELATWRAVLERRRVWLESQGSHYLLVVPPNKETVYAEAMPAWATRAPGPSRLQQLTAYLKATSKVTIVDLTAALESKKGTGRLYHFTDTHWNDLGAFVGYQEVAQRLAAWFPALRPARARPVCRLRRAGSRGRSRAHLRVEVGFARAANPASGSTRTRPGAQRQGGVSRLRPDGRAGAAAASSLMRRQARFRRR